MTQSVILGIGNVLLTDDGAGVHAARQLADLLVARADVQVLDAGTLSFTLAPIIEGADHLIILDATQLNQTPGSLQCFPDTQLDRFLGRGRLTVHEIGLRDVMDVVRLSGTLPRNRALIGIQPASLEWGTELTPCIAASLHSMVRMTLELLESWSVCTQLDTKAINTHERQRA
jgi:hydrogenase maturation protease